MAIGILRSLSKMGESKTVDDYPLMTGLREIAKIHTGDFRLSPNQNLIISNVTSRK